MIVIIAVMIAVTGTVMTTDIPAATDEDKPTKIQTNINGQLRNKASVLAVIGCQHLCKSRIIH